MVQHPVAPRRAHLLPLRRAELLLYVAKGGVPLAPMLREIFFQGLNGAGFAGRYVKVGVEEL